ncbi:MAG: (S)-ureidoglycine aminohydrolase [Rhodobacteraceae bacterium]|nr:(S)-ureidoglycine aminohydrolase [Paracoccaceae bacterium]
MNRHTTTAPEQVGAGEPRPVFSRSYHAPFGGLPGQNELLSGRAVFTEAYAVIPRGVMTDIVTSALPFWDKTRAWIIARPMSGFAETFSQYIVEVAPGGGSARPEPDPGVEGALFTVKGAFTLTIGSDVHELTPGGFAYLPPGAAWTLRNRAAEKAVFHWIRKAYEPVDGLGLPDPLVRNEAEIESTPMPDTMGRWTTTRFFDHDDMRLDMHVTIVSLEPGAEIPFMETHVMEHGLYVLEGKGVYRLNRDWVEVEAGDFMWLRAFCPQGCYAGGPGRFRYLLYKDVNRHPRLRGPGAFGR